MSDSDRKRALELVPALQAIERELEVYAGLLRRWQAKINLVGASTIDTLWTRHFAESMQLADFASLSQNWADLGSGAGFPGLVLSIAQRRAGGVMHLIESDNRKAAFLREVSRETGARAHIHAARCEDILSDLGAEVITSRAMSSLKKLTEMSRAGVENGAICLFLKGRDVGVELTEASTSCNFLMSAVPSRVASDSFIVRVSSS